MQEIKGNILSIPKGIICHQVNCKGVFGAGLAKQIKLNYPLAYREYITKHNGNQLVLGEPFYTKISDDIIIYHLPAQLGFGRTGLHTNYSALNECLVKVKKSLQDLPELPIYIPYKLGCGLGGGDWGIVESIIEETLPEAIIVRL